MSFCSVNPVYLQFPTHNKHWSRRTLEYGYLTLVKKVQPQRSNEHYAEEAMFFVLFRGFFLLNFFFVAVGL